MGKLRDKLEQILHSAGLQVGSSGLGGDVFILRGPGFLIRVARVAADLLEVASPPSRPTVPPSCNG
eukprot:8198656-Pyramimonas_sp.AAC.1